MYSHGEMSFAFPDVPLLVYYVHVHLILTLIGTGLLLGKFLKKRPNVFLYLPVD